MLIHLITDVYFSLNLFIFIQILFVFVRRQRATVAVPVRIREAISLEFQFPFAVHSVLETSANNRSVPFVCCDEERSTRNTRGTQTQSILSWSDHK